MTKPKPPTPTSLLREVQKERGDLNPMARHIVRWCLVWLLANYELKRRDAKPFSAEVVARLLQDRAELLAVVEELFSVERRAGVGKELMNRAKAASTKARGA